MNKFAIILGASALALSTSVMAEATFGDPDEGGIGYEWTVKMPHHGSLEITGSVGGKSLYEPQFEAPNIGWTHTSDWVAVELEADAVLEIEVSRQGGIYEMKVDKDDPTIKTYTTAGAELYPAIAIYTGQDTTTEKEEGSFNPTGKFWATIEPLATQYSKLGETTVVYRAKMSAGKYSVNIGGVNALYCAETAECYNGVHGYHAKFTTYHSPNL